MKKHHMLLRLLGMVLAALTLLTACGAREMSESLLGEPTPEPAEATEPAETPEPTPEPVLYECTVGDTYCYAGPDDTSELLGYIPMGTQAELITGEGDYTQLRLPGGMEVWCRAWMLDPVDPELKVQRDREYLSKCTGKEAFLSMEERKPVYYCILDGLNCYLEPDESSPVVYCLAAGTAVTVYGRLGDWYLLQLPIGKLAWAPVTYLCVTDRFSICENAVDLREWLPEAEFEILFASPNNITGHAMYEPIPMMEATTAGMLKQAYDIFRSQGYTIKVYDAYRPKSAQFQLYDIVQDVRFIANPYIGNSWHQFGRAIDMSLIDLNTGKELLMPTPMHTFSTDASRWNESQWSEEVRNNVDYMTDVMLSCGFGLLSTEWWHFELNRTEEGFYLDNDMDLAALPTKSAY